MRRLMSGLATCALTMISAEAGARNILLVALELEAPRKSILLMDTDTIRTSTTGELRAWSYLYMDVPGKNKMSIIELDAFDCKDLRIKRMKQTFYNLDGTQRFENKDVGTWDFAVPGSNGYRLLDAGCGKVPNKDLILGDVDPDVVFKQLAESGKITIRAK